MLVWSAVVHLRPLKGSDWLSSDLRGAFVRVAARASTPDDVLALVELHLGSLAEIEDVRQLEVFGNDVAERDGELLDLVNLLDSVQRPLVFGTVHTYPEGQSG